MHSKQDGPLLWCMLCAHTDRSWNCLGILLPAQLSSSEGSREEHSYHERGNRALIIVLKSRQFLGLPNAFKNSVFEASKLVSTKTLLLKHYYRRQGLRNEKRARTFLHKLFEHPQGSGTSRQKFLGHPRFLSSKPKEDTLSREGRNSGGEDPLPTRRSPDQKS